MKEVNSFCRMCMGRCGMTITVDEHQAVVAVRGDKDHPLTQGYACFSGLQAPDIHRGPERLLHPLKRQPDGTFVRIELSQALDEIAERLRTIIDIHGPSALAGFKGTGGYSNTLMARLLPNWLKALGSQAMFSTMTVDQSAKWVTTERLGHWDGGRNHFFESDVAMLVGVNPLVSQTTLFFPSQNPVKAIKAARARGTKLIVVDPRVSETARLADLHLQIIPGEDVTLAAGLLRLILSEGWHDAAFCDAYVDGLSALKDAVEPFTPDVVARRAGVPATQLREAAHLFAVQAWRGCVTTGTWPDMGPYSNLAEHLYECLNVVCGRFRRAGERVRENNPLARRRPRRAAVIPPRRSFEQGPRSRVHGTGRLFGEMMSCELVDEMQQPGPGQIRSLLCMAGNPVSALPDPHRTARAFAELDLLVVVDPFMTATAQLAHYVLPPKLQYERPDCTSPGFDLYLESFAQYTPAVAAPPPGAEVVDEWVVLWELARRLDVPLALDGQPLDAAVQPDTEALLDLLMGRGQITADEIRQAPSGRVFDLPELVIDAAPDSTGRFAVLPADVAQELAQAWAEDAALPAATGSTPYTHRLAVRRMRGTINTAYQSMPAVKARHPFNPAYMHPEDLSQLGLADGQDVLIESPHGRLDAVVSADDSVRRGVVSMTHGWGKVLPGEPGEARDGGSSTSFLVSAEQHRETINSMVRLTGIPVRVGSRA
ncbi:MAG: molybdopterin-dependent oxidoreductase [Burkholderiales bacterium]